MPSFDSAATTAEQVTLAGPDSPIEARVFRPTNVQARGVAVYLHGGGWVVGDTLLLEAPSRLISQWADVVVVSVEYRRAPEHPFPAAFDDCWAAVRWASAELAAGLPSVVVGESAGGNLAAAVAASTTRSEEVRLAGQVAVVPALDPAMDTESWAQFGSGFGLDREEMAWFWSSYLPRDVDRTDPRACPLVGNLRWSPPTTVVTCGYDPLQDEGRAYSQRLVSHGVPVQHLHFDHLPHGFFWTAGASSAALEALERIAAEVRRLTATP